MPKRYCTKLMKKFRISRPDDQLLDQLAYYKSNAFKNSVNKTYLNENPEIVTTRTFNGSANNVELPTMSSAGVSLLRKAAPVYADGIGALVNRTPTPRIVSNNLCASDVDTPNALKLSNMCWMWGQFLDHEIGLTRTNSAESADMITPGTDVYPNYTIPFERSAHTEGVTTPRQQPNSISSFVDATNVYGFNAKRAMELRRLDGSGKLDTIVADNSEEIPIYNLKGLDNAAPAGSDPANFFLCGDIRANENIHLTAMHTLFIREHNRLCDIIVQTQPELFGKDEVIYQQARRIVYGEMQQITYKEFLPALLGKYTPSTKQNYDTFIDGGITTEFSTVGYRLGHSLLPSVIPVGTASSVQLRDAFFQPGWIQQNGVDDLLVGGSISRCNELDLGITNAVRNFLFGTPAAGKMLDLASLNIQRARDHGIPDYNTLRAAYGLSKVTNFAQITSNSSIRTKLSQTYSTVDDIDPWIGALAEDHLPTAAVGPLVKEILVEQFDRLLNCDRFWWARDPGLSASDKSIIANTTLARVIRRNINSSKRSNIPSDVFHS